MHSRRTSTRAKLLGVIAAMVLTCCWITRSNRKERCESDASPPANVPFIHPRNSTAHNSKVLCFVLSHPDRAEASISIKNTWGPRCDELLFFSAKSVPELETVVLPDTVDGYYRLWGHVRRIWTYIGQSGYVKQFGWFLKADDDTYVIVENLKRFLNERIAAGMNEQTPVWFGAKLKNPKTNGGYNSGGAGYVLSRRALQLFGNGSACSQLDFGYEDLELGRCLEKVGVAAGDTRDADGRPTFLPFPPEELLAERPFENGPRFGDINDVLANNASWYWKSVWWTHSLGRNCCSHHAISFHRVKPKLMYALDYFIYSLRT